MVDFHGRQNVYKSKHRFLRKKLKCDVTLNLACGRRGLIVSGLNSGASGPGLSPGRGHRFEFLSKTLYSHGASLHPGVWPGLACTCVDLRSFWSRSNLHASQSMFFSVWPPNTSKRKLSDVHLPIISQRNRGQSTLKYFFLRVLVLARKLASLFSHPTQVSTQVTLA